MQISDLMGQYHNSTERPQMTGATGVSKIVSSIKDMGAGNIFEGTVNSVKNGQVVLGLSNGQTVTARLEGKVSLTVGQSMFFQVKSNEGGTISIKPYTVAGNSMNITLMDALKAAGLSVDGRNLSMVNAMMEQQMSIDKASLNEMYRVVSANGDVDVQTLVQMQKLGIPTTAEFTSQFQNYMADKQAIVSAMDDFIMELPKTLISENLPAEQIQDMGREMLSVITEGLSGEVEIPGELAQMIDGESLNLVADEMLDADGNPVEATAAETVAEGNPAEELSEEAGQGVEANQGGQGEAITADNRPQLSIPFTLGSIMSKGELRELNAQINQLLGQELQAAEGENGENPLSQSGVQFAATDSTVAVLGAIRDMLGNSGAMDQKLLLALFSGREFQALVRDAMEQQWLLKPKDLGASDKVSKLYEKMESQLERIESIVKVSGQESQNISQLAADIRNNIQFMNEINQAYTYVQIPLKLSGQNASGELYVYTNKKNLQAGGEELSAFLHLDMDHLGSTDVSVRMRGKQVDTKFYFDNDETYNLVNAYVPRLEARLREKGYNCNVTVANEGKSVNFVEDFLKKDTPSAGLVHRYSFDMRA